MRRGVRHLFVITAIVVLFGVVFSSLTHALAVPPKPTESPVVDQTDTLSESERSTISQKIASERSSTGNQIAVLVIPSLQGEILEDYSIQVARGWGIGQKERDSGILLLVVKNDHKVRIEVGYGLEGALPDIRANQIIRDRMIPAFKQEKYYDGITSGVDGITTAIHGEVDPHLSSEPVDTFTGGIELLPVFFFVGFVGLSWFGAILGRSKRAWPGGAIGAGTGVAIAFLPGLLIGGIASIFVLTLLGLLFDKTVSSNYRNRTSIGRTPNWWAGGGFGGESRGGDGGFGGFGGGGFGGGGASGSW